MGYGFPAIPRDVLTATPPQLSLNGRPAAAGSRLSHVLLATVLAVPAFRRMLLQMAGLSGGGGADDVFVDVKYPGESARVPGFAGVIGVKGGANSALLLVRPQTFLASEPRDVDEIVRALGTARDRKIARVITVCGLIPGQSLVSAVRERSIGAGAERLRSLTWMGTVDLALHLLERRAVRLPGENYLLQQYVRFVREEAIRDRHARLERAEGPLYFGSMGEDWRTLARDFAREGSVDPKDPRLAAVAGNWLAFLRFASLHLSPNADILSFPNVRKPLARPVAILKRLKDEGQLMATFERRGDKGQVILSADLKRSQIVFQVQLPGPKAKQEARIGDLAYAIRDDRTVGETRIKIFWPGERQPRVVSRKQAVSDAIATAPPQHGLLPERFIIERIVRAETIISEPESFAQLLLLELRGFRASVRQVLRRGTPGA